MKSADDAAENVDDAAVEDDSRRLDNSSSVDSSTYKTAKDESFANQVSRLFKKYKKKRNVETTLQLCYVCTSVHLFKLVV